MDARVLNDDGTPEVLAEMDRLAGLGQNRKLLLYVLRRGSRILDRLFVIADPVEVTNRFLLWRSVAAFKSIRVALSGPTDPEAIEYVICTPAEEREFLTRMRIPRID